MTSDHVQRRAINLEAFVRNLRMDRDANENFARAQMRLSRNDEKDRAVKVVLLNGSEMRAGRWNNRYSGAYYFLLL